MTGQKSGQTMRQSCAVMPLDPGNQNRPSVRRWVKFGIVTFPTPAKKQAGRGSLGWLVILLSFTTGISAVPCIGFDETVNVRYTRIQKVDSRFPRRYRTAFDRCIQLVAPNGKPIHLFAQPEISDAQLRRVRNVMLHFLTDFEGSKYGSRKADIANRMADNRAMMMLCKGHDGQFREPRIPAQPLYADETIVEGSRAYIENDFENHRDATFEEVLHAVHDQGIGVDVRGAPRGAARDYQKTIREATTLAMTGGLWPTPRAQRETREWIEELREEGSLTQEYLASVIDSYYGLWGPFDENYGMWGIYIAKTRADIRKKDPRGLEVVRNFFHPTLFYTAEIDPKFKGNFSMTFDPLKKYTHKSQYLTRARLTGTENSGLIGNAHANLLTGNQGNNLLNGKDGFDTVVYPRARSAYRIQKNQDGTQTVHGDGTDRLVSIERLVFDGQQLEDARYVDPVAHGLR